MTLFESIEKRGQLYRHGGREVLRVAATHVTGKSAAAQHTEALVLALITYAEQTLLPCACQALDLALANGSGYAFHSHQYHINVVEKRVAHGVMITLAAALQTSDAYEERTLIMYWTQDGTWQKRRHHRER